MSPTDGATLLSSLSLLPLFSLVNIVCLLRSLYTAGWRQKQHKICEKIAAAIQNDCPLRTKPDKQKYNVAIVNIFNMTHAVNQTCIKHSPFGK